MDTFDYHARALRMWICLVVLLGAAADAHAEERQQLVALGRTIEETATGFAVAFERLFQSKPSCQLPVGVPESYPDTYTSRCELRFRAYRMSVEACDERARASLHGGSMLAAVREVGGTGASMMPLHRASVELCELACKDTLAFARCIAEADANAVETPAPGERSDGCTVEYYERERRIIDNRMTEASAATVESCERDPGCDPMSPGFQSRLDTLIDDAIRAAASARANLDGRCLPPTPSKGFVRRVQLASRIEAREPADDLFYLATGERIVLFLELIQPPLDAIIYDWYFGDVLKASVQLPVKRSAGRWRTWSSKELVPEWAGPWTIVVRDTADRTLVRESFLYRPLY